MTSSFFQPYFVESCTTPVEQGDTGLIKNLDHLTRLINHFSVHIKCLNVCKYNIYRDTNLVETITVHYLTCTSELRKNMSFDLTMVHLLISRCTAQTSFLFYLGKLR